MMLASMKGCGPRKAPRRGAWRRSDHFLRSGLLRLLSSQSLRLACGSLRQRLGGIAMRKNTSRIRLMMLASMSYVYRLAYVCVPFLAQSTVCKLM